VIHLALAALAALGTAAPAASPAPFTEIHWVMGTFLRVTAEGPGARAAARACFDDARRLDRTFSRFDPASELTHVHAAAGTVTDVSPDFARLLAAALRLGDATGHAFDATAGALTALWRDGGAPSATDRLTARSRPNGAVQLDGRRLRLAPGVRLDFDGIAKGYATDACAARLRAAGVRRALVSFGESSLVAIGAPHGDDAWALDVRGPEPGTLAGTLRLRDAAASVSATRTDDGPAVGRIVDPRSGDAVAAPAVAVVTAASATDAEALTKALLVWGPAGTARVERLGAIAAVHLGAAGATRGPGAERRAMFAAFAVPVAWEGAP
jgi:thiamine biosynthesis lipoprotein